MTTPVQEFTDIVLRNLEKNGFPTKSVSFPLEKLYEGASQRGFSFNKVRDELRTRHIESEIDGEKIIFSKRVLPKTESNVGSEGFDESRMASMAQDMLARMSPSQREQIMEMMKNLKPEDMARMKEQWETMPLEEKQKAMRNFQGG